jgi:hypothetical protein
MTASYVFVPPLLHFEEHQEDIEENPGTDTNMFVYKFLCFCMYFFFFLAKDWPNSVLITIYISRVAGATG